LLFDDVSVTEPLNSSGGRKYLRRT